MAIRRLHPYDVFALPRMRGHSPGSRFGLEQYRLVMLKPTDALVFSKDPGTSPEGVVNVVRPLLEGTSATGHRSVIESKGKRRTIIFIRKGTGRHSTDEATFAMKLAALLHEPVHVNDHEKSVNYDGDRICLVDAEAYAHHHACGRMLAVGVLLCSSST